MSARPVAALMVLSAVLLSSNANGQALVAGVPSGASADQQPEPQPGEAPAATKPDAAQPASAQPLPAQPDTAQPDTAQPGAPQPQAPQPDPANPDAAQPQAGQADGVPPGAPQPDGVPPSAPQPDGVQPGGSKSEGVQPGSGQPEPAAPGSAQGASGPAPDQAASAPVEANSSASGAPEASGAQASERDPLAPLDDPDGPVDVPSTRAWQVINWVIATHDNNNMPFIVIDKIAAEVFLFDPDGQRIGASPALVGMTAGDDATAWVGDREMSNIPPKDRTTPAGRFIANLGPAVGHRDVLWIDYPDAISLHAVINVKNQHRLERLRTPSPDDNRITYGCINVPAEFYAKVIKPVFKGKAGVVYILPDVKALSEVFLAMPQPVQQLAQPQVQQDPQPGLPPSSQSSH